MFWWTLLQLRSKDPYRRIRAACKLGDLKDVRAIEYLVPVLRDEETDVREAVAKALTKIASMLLSAWHRQYRIYYKLEEKPWDNSEFDIHPDKLYLHYQNALSKMSPNWPKSEITQKVIPAYMAVLKDEHGEWNVARKVLEKIDPNWQKSDGAKSAVTSLIAALNNKKSHAHAALAEVLGEIRDTRSVEPLIAALNDEDTVVRREVAKALGRIRDIRAVEPLVAVFNSGGVSEVAAEALGEIGDDRAVKPLLSAFSDKDLYIWNTVAVALDKLDPHWTKSEVVIAAIPTLVAALKGHYSQVAPVLIKIGYAAVEPLIVLLNDKDSDDARRVAAEALGEIRDSRAVKPLLKTIMDYRLWVRSAAAEGALKKIDPNWEKLEAARETIPSLVVALTDNNYDVREAAARILKRIDSNWAESEEAKLAVPSLLAILKNKQYWEHDWERLATAAKMLGEIRDMRAVESLVFARTCEWQQVQEVARDALKKINPKWGKSEDAKACVPQLISIAAIEHKGYRDLDVRKSSVQTLGDIGDIHAVEGLLKLSSDTALSEIAVHTLQQVLEVNVQSFPQDILRAIIGLNNLTQIVQHYGACGYAYTTAEPTDGFQLKQIARQELIRRGLEV